MAAVVGGRGDALSATEWPSAYIASRLEKELMLFRCYWSGTWRPEMRLTGAEHVSSALRTGRGVVLWVAPFVLSDLVTKMTFQQSGFDVTHLSRFSHGYSDTKFGVAVLNPIHTRIEDRYLAERVVMGPEGSAAGLRAWSRQLARGKLVSIALGHRGRRVHTIPFLDGQITVADGAVKQARRAGAVLLPVFTVREASGCFDTHVGAPLPANDIEAPEADTVKTIAAYVALLEGYASSHPEQWCWHIKVSLPPKKQNT